MKVLIDTKIYSLAMRGDRTVVSRLRLIDTIGFTAVSIGELFSGFRGGNNEEKNRKELGQFLASDRVRVHAIDGETADYYGEILWTLRQAGTPIPTNDIWIAASVVQHGYRLFTNDSHFDRIPGLMRFH